MNKYNVFAQSHVVPHTWAQASGAACVAVGRPHVITDRDAHSNTEITQI